MSQVMRNLLNNAINHSPENQEIFIRLIPKENNCLVEVATLVPHPGGRPRHHLGTLPAANDQSSRRLGTGIGLSIVSTILKETYDMPYGVWTVRMDIIFSGLYAGNLSL